MKRTGLNGYFYDFSVNCNIYIINNIVVDDILDIHKYLIKKHGVV